MKKTLHFLSGVPRSGSTVLAAILNQNPATHVSTTSGLVHALNGLAVTWHQASLLKDNDPDRSKLAETMRGTIDSFYENTDKPVVIDKGRGWPQPSILQSMGMVLKRTPKIIATVRSIPDCMASFVRVAKPKTIEELDEFMYEGPLVKHLQASYIGLREGYNFWPECFLFVEYENLLADPKKELERIHEFLELAPFEYDFGKIDGSSVKEDDENLHGYSGMHDIKPVLARQHEQDPKDVLKHHYTSFMQDEFWNNTPKPERPPHDLDLQLAASTRGDFEEGWRLCQQLEQAEPLNHRAAFNRGWYYLNQGKIQQGYQLLDRGRIVKVFGDSTPDNVQQRWDGKLVGTILLYLEGGMGDQIHQARWARLMADRGNRVIVSCSPHLVPLMSTIDGVSAVVQHGVDHGVYHDAWVAGMSAVVPLGLELADLSGAPYIQRKPATPGKKLRIGLRWQGNKDFEDQHHKLFPSALMFSAVRGASAEFISLQRDGGSEHRPDWVKQVPLDTWQQTQDAVSTCDLVISSCTSVSHLAAAMGVETWVVIPVMPYFLYALPGADVPYYDSMRLFRQTTYGEWQQPFSDIKTKLTDLIASTK